MFKSKSGAPADVANLDHLKSIIFDLHRELGLIQNNSKLANVHPYAITAKVVQETKCGTGTTSASTFAMDLKKGRRAKDEKRLTTGHNVYS